MKRRDDKIPELENVRCFDLENDELQDINGGGLFDDMVRVLEDWFFGDPENLSENA
ncbi:MAG: hypothetical protein AAGA64_13450 [Bacteroidota bacterium]